MKNAALPLFISLFSLLSCSSPDTGKPNSAVVEDEFIFYGEPFAAVPGIDDMRIYEAFPRVFAENNSLQAIRSRLDKIQALNVNVIWIMPVFKMSSKETGGRAPYGSPYCMTDFYSIDPEFGTLNDLRALVDDAHARNISVILDLVTNSTGWDHSWVKEHPEFYAIDENGQMYCPNKGNTPYNNSVQLDWNSPGLRKEFINIMKYWVAIANIDGYRCDSATWTPADFWEEAISAVRSMQPERRVIFLGEGTYIEGMEAGMDLCYGWNFCDTMEKLFNAEASVNDLFKANETEWEQIAGLENKTKVRLSTNHDRSASASPVQKYGSREAAFAAFALAATMGGVPMIYGSQEVDFPERIPIFKGSSKQVDWSASPDTFERYRRIMQATASETMRKGSLARIANDNIISFTRTYSDEEILVMVNPSAEKQNFTLPATYAGAQYENLMESSPADRNFSFGGISRLDAYAVLILHKKKNI